MRRIMIIDDEPSIRRTLQSVLTRAGYAVVLAADGAEGVRLCTDSVPDLVITDIRMPGPGGIETIAALRALMPGLPVIAMSGGNLHALAESTAPLRDVGTLAKPFTVPEVLAAVEKALGSRPRSL